MRRWRRSLGAVLLFLAVLGALLGGGFWLVEAFLAAWAWLAVALCAATGALLVAAAFAGFFQVAALLCRGRRTLATVVETVRSASPTLQFTDADGRQHVVSGAVSGLGRAFGAGQQVPLVYLPDRPQTFVVDWFGDKWGGSLVLLLLGSFVLLLSSLFVFDLKQLLVARTDLFGPLVCFTVGGFFSAVGLTAAVEALRFRRRAVRAVGVIVASERAGIGPARKRRLEGGQKFLTELPAPQPGEAEPRTITVEYEDATGARRRGTAEVSWPAGERRYEVGARVAILHDPDRPWDLRTDTFLNWFWPLVVGLSGAVWLGIGLLLCGVRPPGVPG